MSTPKSFVRNGDVVTFRYDSSFLKEWLYLGSREGATGPILVSIDYKNQTKRFASYGTLENPRKVRYWWNMKHWTVMDGPLKSPEEYINPVEFSPFKDYGWFVPGEEKGTFNKIELKWK